MTQAVDLKEFEEFQGRAFYTALGLWMAALGISLLVCWGYSPVVGGIFLGGAAGLAAYRFRVWTLRRLAGEPTARRAGRLPLVSAGRYLIQAAGLGLAAWLGAVTGDVRYVIAAAAALFVGNAAVILQAVRDSRRPAEGARK